MTEIKRPDPIHQLLWSLICRKIRFGDSYDGQDHAGKVTDLDEANVVTSLRQDGKHALVLDIDYEAFLVESSTAGHYHLYLDVPGGIPHNRWEKLMTALAKAGVIEAGYADASINRGYTAVRLPWIKKQEPVF